MHWIFHFRKNSVLIITKAEGINQSANGQTTICFSDPPPHCDNPQSFWLGSVGGGGGGARELVSFEKRKRQRAFQEKNTQKKTSKATKEIIGDRFYKQTLHDCIDAFNPEFSQAQS